MANQISRITDEDDWRITTFDNGDGTVRLCIDDGADSYMSVDIAAEQVRALVEPLAAWLETQR
ncbi:hypothetical protein ACFYU5_19280 [Nocardia aobensis]|uniref:Uncharacterized protein n=1 Tax=Nocardia aobensis TaxID=257277 RepID=A0ABW6P5Y4_9NOCA